MLILAADETPLDAQLPFTIHSNLTLIGSADTLPNAKDFASNESKQYDDAVIVRKNGIAVYFAQYGTLYSLRPLNHGRIMARTE